MIDNRLSSPSRIPDGAGHGDDDVINNLWRYTHRPGSNYFAQ